MRTIFGGEDNESDGTNAEDAPAAIDDEHAGNSRLPGSVYVGEENVSTLSRCIRLNNDCADICEMAGRILSRQNSTDWDLVESVLSNVILASNLCADECEKHEGHHEHCRICAEVCRNCAEVCH